MKLFVQWTQNSPTDWIELDSSVWSSLPKKPLPTGNETIDNIPGWIYAINIQGNTFQADHISVEQLNENEIRVCAWNDDPKDWPDGTRKAHEFIIRPLGPNERKRGAITTHNTGYLYLEGEQWEKYKNRGNPNIRPYSEFKKPSENITFHGKWVSDELAELHDNKRSRHTWREWIDGVPEEYVVNGEVRTNFRRDLNMFDPPKGTITYYMVDDASSDITGTYYSNYQLTGTSPASSTTVSWTQGAGINKDTDGQSVVTWTTESGVPGKSDWPSGTYKNELDIITWTNINSIDIEVWLTTSDGTQTTLLASQNYTGGAGSDISTSASTDPGNDATYRFQTAITGNTNGSHSNPTLEIGVDDSDDYSEGPWVADVSVSDNRSAKVTGQIITNDNRSSKITGSTTTTDNRSATTTGGITSTDNRSATIAGTATTSDNRSAKTTGSLTSIDNRPAKVEGSAGTSSNDNRSAKITGAIDDNSSRSATITGVSATVDYVIVDTGGSGDYSSLTAWDADGAGGRGSRDITAATGSDEIVIVECQASTGLADTDTLSFGDAWKTAQDNYIQIYTEPNGGYRHNGTYQTGNKYRMETSGSGITMSQGLSGLHELKFIGLQIKSPDANSNAIFIRPGWRASPGFCYIEHCVLVGVNPLTGSNTAHGIYITGEQVDYYISNCIIYDFYSSGWYCRAIHIGNGQNAYINNVTVVDCHGGISQAQGTVEINNCIVQGAVGIKSYAGTLTGNNNICNKADDAMPGNQSIIGTVTFIGGDDYHLDNSDTIALGAGADLSAHTYTITDDIDRDLRYQWSIGADEGTANYRQGSRSAKISGPLTVNDSRSAKVSGLIIINDSRSAKVSGLDTTNDSRSAKITGAGGTQVADNRDAKITGEIATTNNRSATITGQITSTENRPATVTGSINTNDNRNAKVSGTSTTNDSRSAKITGQQTTNDNRDAKVSGTVSTNDSRSAKVSGQITSTDNRSAVVSGKATQTSNRNAKISGIAGANDNRSAKVSGIATTTDNRSATVAGTLDTNSVRSATVTGQILTSENRDAKVSGVDISTDNRNAKISGSIVSTDNRNAKINGVDTAIENRSATITGSITVSSNRSAKISGVAGSNDSRSAKISGLDTAIESRSAKTTGLITTSSNRSAKVSGANAAIDNRPAKISGLVTTVDNRLAKISGTNTDNDNRSAKIIGSVDVSENRLAKISGIDTTNSSRSATITGTTNSISDRPAKISGINTTNSSRSAILTGGITSTNNRNSKVSGIATDNDNRSAKVSGIDTATSSRSAKISGTLTSNDNRSAKTTGSINISENRSAKISGLNTTSDSRLAKISGITGSIDSRPSKVSGIDTANDNRPAKTTGLLTTNSSRSAKVSGIAGANDNRLAKISGVDTANDNRSATVSGTLSSSDSRLSKIAGQNTATDNIDAKVSGLDTTNDSRLAKISGTISSSDNRNAKTSGLDTTSDSRPATVTGTGSPNDSRSAKITGVLTANDNRDSKIIGKLETSDNRNAKISGILASSRPATITGIALLSNDNRSAKTHGQNITTDNRNAKTTGTAGELVNSSINANITGKIRDGDTRTSWLTNVQNSVILELQNYLENSAETSYNINSPNKSNNIRVIKGYPDDEIIRAYSQNIISVSVTTTPTIDEPNQLGNFGWTYKMNIQFDVFCVTNRHVKTLLYEISKFTRNEIQVYDWYVRSLGLGLSGTLSSFLIFDKPITKIIRDNKNSAHKYLKHSGRSTALAKLDTDNLEII
jgi:hypothetical protein